MSILVQNQPLDNIHYVHSLDPFTASYESCTWYIDILKPSKNIIIEDPILENLKKYVFKDDDFDLDFTSELCLDCVGGTYILKDNNGVNFAVFKPYDEEPGCCNNPKNNYTVLKVGVKPGEGAIREYSAYLLDHGGFARVPKTGIMEIGLNGERKIGSVQKYVENMGTMDDFGSGLFSVDNIQRIAQFDIRTLNMDRNLGNLLVVNEGNGNEMIPIDHSYILPERLNGSRFDWANWKQASLPIEDHIIKYIMDIDIDKDILLLEKLNLSKIAIEYYKIATLFLKKATSNKWTFKQMADFLCNKTNEKTKLEEIIEKLKNITNQ